MDCQSFNFLYDNLTVRDFQRLTEWDDIWTDLKSNLFSWDFNKGKKKYVNQMTNFCIRFRINLFIPYQWLL